MDDGFWKWVRYYVSTEAYDRSVCSGRSEYDGNAIPTNEREMAMISQNAHQERRRQRIRSTTPGKRDASQHPHEHLVQRLPDMEHPP